MVAESLMNASEKRTRLDGEQPAAVVGCSIWEISVYTHEGLIGPEVLAKELMRLASSPRSSRRLGAEKEEVQ